MVVVAFVAVVVEVEVDVINVVFELDLHCLRKA